MSKYMNYRIFVATLILSVFGILMIFSAEMYSFATMAPKMAILSIIKQIAFLFLGFILLFFCYRNFDAKNLSKLTSNAMVLIMLVLLLVPRIIFPSYNAAKDTYAWIPFFGIMTLQPSEFFKLFYILFFAQYVYKYSRYFKLSLYSTKYPALFLGIVLVIVGIFQKDLGTSIIIFFIGVGCYIGIPFSILKKKQKMLLYIFIGILVFYLILFEPLLHLVANSGLLKEYQAQRLLAVFDPLGDTKGTTMQLSNGMIAISNGGLFGRGLGNSMMKYGFIPEVNNDFIFAVIAEELGFIAVCILVLLYCLIIFELLKYAQKTNDLRHRIILFGISAYFFAHMFVNMGGVSGLIPMTGVPLLFISAGGSSLLTAMMMSGIALAIIKNEKKARENMSHNIRNRNQKSTTTRVR